MTYLPDGAYTYANRGEYKLEEGYSIFEFFMVKNAGVNPDNGNMDIGLEMIMEDGLQLKIIQM